MKMLKITSHYPRRLAALLLCVALAVAFMPPMSAYAQSGTKTVRVGWYESPFNQTDAFGRRSGYAYEYQQKISAYTGWNYEYVEGSWPELLEMLIDGEIDLMSDVSYTDERAETMLFSEQPMGTEDYFVFVSLHNESGINAKDASSFNGKRFGVNKGSVQESLFLDWAEKKNIQAEIVELMEEEQQSAAMLNRGELDALVSLHSFSQYHDMAPVCKIGASDFFFAVSKARPELLSELNFAMSRIQEENAYYVQNLYKKYIGSSYSNRLLTQNEQNWLAGHGPIRIGYREDYLAFCASDPDTGELTGALRDFLEQASHAIENVEIKFEATPFSSPTDSLEALMRGEVDCLFPTNVSDYDGEQVGLSLTLPLMQTGIVAVGRQTAQREFSLQGDVTVAVSKEDPDYDTILMNSFPDWNRAYFENAGECLAAVAEGKADCLLVSNYRVSRLSDALEKYRLTTVSTGESMSFSVAVRHEDTYLYAILNKVTNLIPSSSMNASLAYYSYAEQPVTFASFMRQNMFPALAVIGIVFALILLLLLRSIRSEEKTKGAMQRIAALNEEQKNRLEEISKLNAALSESQQNLKVSLNAAERANQAKTKFLSNMSHEIRTPMNAIIGLDNIALKAPDLPPHTREQLEKIDTSAKHLLGIINDILDMSRIESGRMTLKDEEFSFREFLEQINVMVNSQCVDKGLQFDCKIIGRTEDYYVGDDTKLKQVLLNILGNAVKFTEAPGLVTLTIEQTACFENHRSLRFIVSDTGIGMSKDYIPKIFEAFSQEKEGYSNKLGSTGLGMAITKSIVTMMNGDIKVESEQGVGSAFTVTVTLNSSSRSAKADGSPALSDGAPAAVADETRDSPLSDGLAGRLMLVVEDMEINAEILMSLLEMEEIRSERAENGQVAVDMFSEHPVGYYDAILMDVRMPVMDGLEATRTIRSLNRPDAKSIPIIAMTANAFDEDVQQSLQAGMNAHLSKPMEPERLYETLGQALRSGYDGSAL